MATSPDIRQYKISVKSAITTFPFSLPVPIQDCPKQQTTLTGVIQNARCISGEFYLRGSPFRVSTLLGRAIQKSRHVSRIRDRSHKNTTDLRLIFRATGKTCFLNLNCISFRPHFENPKDTQTVCVSFAIFMWICPFPSSRTGFPVKQILFSFT